MELLVDDDMEENPLGGLSMSWTATLGNCGTGSLRCVPSGLDMMSEILGPTCPPPWAEEIYWGPSGWGSMGARAGVCCSVKCRIDGRCSSLAPKGRNRGEWAGVASGV